GRDRLIASSIRKFDWPLKRCREADSAMSPLVSHQGLIRSEFIDRHVEIAIYRVPVEFPALLVEPKVEIPHTRRHSVHRKNAKFSQESGETRPAQSSDGLQLHDRRHLCIHSRGGKELRATLLIPRRVHL